MKLTIVEKNLLSWTAMHIDLVMCNKFAEALRVQTYKIVCFISITRAAYAVKESA